MVDATPVEREIAQQLYTEMYTPIQREAGQIPQFQPNRPSDHRLSAFV
jgi:hypothetical protein